MITINCEAPLCDTFNYEINHMAIGGLTLETRTDLVRFRGKVIGRTGDDQGGIPRPVSLIGSKGELHLCAHRLPFQSLFHLGKGAAVTAMQIVEIIAKFDDRIRFPIKNQIFETNYAILGDAQIVWLFDEMEDLAGHGRTIAWEKIVS